MHVYIGSIYVCMCFYAYVYTGPCMHRHVCVCCVCICLCVCTCVFMYTPGHTYTGTSGTGVCVCACAREIYQKRSPNPVLFHRGRGGGVLLHHPEHTDAESQNRGSGLSRSGTNQGDGRAKRSRGKNTYHIPQGRTPARLLGQHMRKESRTCSTQARRSISGP